MKYKGIIFDFNGTLFCDSHLHKLAWREYSKRLTGVEFTDEEMVKHMFGRTNEQIIEYAIKRKPTPEMVEEIGQEKEAYYNKLYWNGMTIGVIDRIEKYMSNNWANYFRGKLIALYGEEGSNAVENRIIEAINMELMKGVFI